MLTEAIVASRNGRQVYQSKAPTTIRLQVSFMIFLLVEIPSISNPVRWSNWAEEIAGCEQMKRYEMLRILQEFLNVFPSCGWDLPMMLGLSAIWTWFVPRFVLSKKEANGRSSAVRKSRDSTAPCPCHPLVQKCRRKWCSFWSDLTTIVITGSQYGWEDHYA